MTDTPRLSATEIIILEILVANGESYGLQMIEESDGKLKRGTIYVTLSRMEAKGYIESRLEPARVGEHGPPRRLYKATGHGAHTLEGHRLLKAFASGKLSFGLGGALR